VAAAAAGGGCKAKVGDIFTPTEEHGSLRTMLRGFAETMVEPQAKEFNRAEKFNVPLFQELGKLGLLGITVDEKYGGSGMDATAVVIANEELSASDPAFCLSFLAHSLLFANNLNCNGNEEQKARLLPRICTGELLGGMGMTEPASGTDVLGMKSHAKKHADGSFSLYGAKMWITNGSRADGVLGDVFLVYARTAAADAKPAGGKAHSLFLVEKGMPGFALGQVVKDKCGMRASNTAELVFDGVRVPAANVVGTEGDAMLHMMRNLELERLALAAMSLGIARRSIEIMNRYARDRLSFGQPLNRYGQIQKHIADSYAAYAAGRAYVYNVASRHSLTATGGRLDSDGVKLYCSEMATAVANRAMQVLGGNGYTGEYVVERLWRDAKLLEIGGGTTEAHEKNMTRDMTKVDRLP